MAIILAISAEPVKSRRAPGTVIRPRVDGLSPETTAAVAAGLVRSLDTAQPRRTFAAVTDALLAEARLADAGLADRLSALLQELAG